MNVNRLVTLVEALAERLKKNGPGGRDVRFGEILCGLVVKLEDLRTISNETLISQLEKELGITPPVARPKLVSVDARPQIELQPGELHSITDKATEALAKSGTTYERIGELVHVTAGEKTPFREQRPSIKKHTRYTILEALQSSATWVKEKRGTVIKTDPPRAVAQAVLAREQWPNIRPLTGVIQAPALRPDGTILQDDGYDATTGLLYLKNADYPRVEDCTYEAAQDSVKQLLAAVQDFPFAKPLHESVWLAALLTCVARPAIDGPVPLFAVSSTAPGTGKTKLVEITAQIATGTSPLMVAQVENQDEMRKHIASAIYDGDPVIVIDNVWRQLGGPALDTALTASWLIDRPIGESRAVHMPNRAVFFATGNDIVFSNDTARRVLSIDLAPTKEGQIKSEFAHKDLRTWVSKERPRLVGCALTILHAYFRNGCVGRDKAVPWSSFESWSRLIPPIFTWLKMSNPMDAQFPGYGGLSAAQKAKLTR